MKKKKIIIGFIAGASIGVLAAILLSPNKGSDTRQLIADKASDLGNSVKDCLVDLFKAGKKQAAAAA